MEVQKLKLEIESPNENASATNQSISKLEEELADLNARRVSDLERMPLQIKLEALHRTVNSWGQWTPAAFEAIANIDLHEARSSYITIRAEVEHALIRLDDILYAKSHGNNTPAPAAEVQNLSHKGRCRRSGDNVWLSLPPRQKRYLVYSNEYDARTPVLAAYARILGFGTYDEESDDMMARLNSDQWKCLYNIVNTWG